MLELPHISIRNDMKEKKNVDRRDFLIMGACVAAGTAMYSVGPAFSHMGEKHDDGGKAAPKETRASAKNSWGMVIDVNKCTSGCTACVDACRKENNVPNFPEAELDIHWIRKITFRQKGVPNAEERQLPAMCFHCEDPPCAHVCPVAATFVRKDGIVLVDKHRCIGCRYCMVACPYKARSFVSRHVEPGPDANPDVPVRMHGVVEKCTFCVHRIDSGYEPACVVACREKGEGAMTFGDFGDPDSEITKMVQTSKAQQIRPDLGTGPRVWYMGI